MEQEYSALDTHICIRIPYFCYIITISQRISQVEKPKKWPNVAYIQNILPPVPCLL